MHPPGPRPFRRSGVVRPPPSFAGGPRTAWRPCASPEISWRGRRQIAPRGYRKNPAANAVNPRIDSVRVRRRATQNQSMILKGVTRFSEKIVLKQSAKAG